MQVRKPAPTVGAKGAGCGACVAAGLLPAMNGAWCGAGKETCTYGGGKGGGVLPFVAAGLLPAMNGAGWSAGKETCTYGGDERRWVWCVRSRRFITCDERRWVWCR